jgi:hypothetical protein
MNKLQSILLLISTLIFFILFSCSENVLDPVNPSAKIIEELSTVQTKVQFGLDRIYNYKLAVESSYLPSDSLKVKAFFTNGGIRIDMDLYDDGISDSLYRNDLVASNNIWSGGINSNDFPEEGDWELNIEVFILDSTLISDHIFTNILVNSNTAPQINSITGIVEADTLESGFDTRNLTISITDPDNDAIGYNDNQTLKLEIRNRDNIPKDYVFQREDPLSNLMIQLDSTLACSLATNNNYDLTFIATDYYGEVDSLSFGSIRIENTAPIIINVEYPDSINTPESGILWVYAQINDSQGHLSYQDIDSVKIKINSEFHELLDDGIFIGSGDEEENDGIYTKGFSYDVGNSGSFGIEILASDNAGNISSPVYGNITLYSVKNNINIGNDNVQEHNYSNPFNTK